jgi:AcrR family transcriptional regulator
MEPKTERILAAALRLLNQHGYKKVTMSDLADAAGISRPTLYAEFANKDAVVAGVLARHLLLIEAETADKLPRARTLKAQLALIFEIWIIAPFASAIDTDHGRDLMANIERYAPAGIETYYQRLTTCLGSVLEPAMTAATAASGTSGKRAISARDLARILALASKGLKVATSSLAELRRMIDGLIAMTVATVAS